MTNGVLFVIKGGVEINRDHWNDYLFMNQEIIVTIGKITF